VGAGSTDLMLLTIMILRRVIVEKVCRVGTPYDAYPRVKTGKYLGTLQVDESPVFLGEVSSGPHILRAANCWLDSR
jgi:hypothetical protein